MNLNEIVWGRDVTVFRVEGSKLKELPVLDNDQEQLLVNECRECHSSTELTQMLSPCNCVEERAYIHFHCLKDLIETSGQQKCGICGQNWLGIEIVKKRKSLTEFLGNGSQIFEIFFPLFAAIFAIILFAFYINAIDPGGKLIFISSFINFMLALIVILNLFCIIFDFISWRKNNYNYTVTQCIEKV